MTPTELFAATGSAYTALIHLERATSAAETILQFEPRVPDPAVTALLRGDTWRERLVGLVLVCRRGLTAHFEDLRYGLHDVRGLAIVPTAAVTAIAVADFGCPLASQPLAPRDPAAFDGEIVWARAHLEHVVGRGPAPTGGQGPHAGQVFENHLAFYRSLCLPTG